MRLTFAASLVLALGLMTTSPALAQQHRATRLGNPGTRFSKPLKNPDDVRILLRGERTKADVQAILDEVGWKGNPEDLDRGAATADISPVEIAQGTRIPFMASRKNRKPHALVDVLWAGRKPIDAFAFEFSSSCERYRVVVPKACGNFWLEDLGRDTESEGCRPRLKPVVHLRGADSACVTQPVDLSIDVDNPPDDNKVAISVNGKELVSDTLTNGSYRFTFTGAPQPGRYEITAVSGSETATQVVEVKSCEPTCGLTAGPQPVRAGKAFTVDVSGSQVATGVRGGVKSARIEVVDPDGNVVGTYDLAAPNFSRSDVTIKKGGVHTLRATVTDEAGQTSTNTCQAQVDVKAGPPVYVGAYLGKERLVHDDHDGVNIGALCSAIAGIGVGFQPMIGESLQFDGQVGLKIGFEDNSHTTAFADAALNYAPGRGFFGAGLSWWDVGKDTSDLGLLVQGGFDLDSDGKWQLVGQARAPFSQFDDIDNNYQVWGGIRFRPFHWQ
jgi:hypothetical protein